MSINFLKQNKECKISRDISKRILCLPVYVELEKDVQVEVINIIKGNLI